MGKASAGKQAIAHRQQIAARQAAARRAQIRNRMLLAGGAIIAVVAVALALVLVKVNSKPAAAAPPADGPAGAALARVVNDLTSVPASVLDTVGAGSLSGSGIGRAGTSGSGYLAPVSGAPLTSGGKPEVLYLGADFCPYCAAVRWPLIVALSRFGTFSGLGTTRSGIANGAGQHEPYPGTPTWTFYRSRYTSRYLTFTPVELQTNIPDPQTGGYTGLQRLTAAQQDLMTRYDPAGSISFIDIGNAYVQLSSLTPYGPQDLQNLTWSQIAAALHHPSSAVAKRIGGSANYLTAAICKLTGDQPAGACTPAVRALESRLG
jgi:Domain of unknown function (DUF929)